jgi:HD superfamily phosphodiesterase
MRQAALAEMKRYYGESTSRIEHTERVLDYAERIMDGECLPDGFLRDVVTITAIFHDIGIPNAIASYGTSAHQHQEQEGVPVARGILRTLNCREDIMERVCYIVGHHHTGEAIDGQDFQILWEADALVNIPARTLWSLDQKKAQAATVFKTATGKRIAGDVIK